MKVQESKKYFAIYLNDATQKVIYLEILPKKLH